MYKVLFVDSFLGDIEEELNVAAEEGYVFKYGFQVTTRTIIIMEKQPKRGRPSGKKEEDEEGANLGD